jgi:hypothetical protein
MSVPGGLSKLVAELRHRGFNARSVGEIFGKDPGCDVPIGRLPK